MSDSYVLLICSLLEPWSRIGTSSALPSVPNTLTQPAAVRTRCTPMALVASSKTSNTEPGASSPTLADSCSMPARTVGRTSVRAGFTR